MNEQEIDRLSLLKRVVNWLVPDVQENASAQVEVTENTQEEEMDIEILKNALSDVVDQKLETFATSIKEEIEASVQNKIDDITKGFEASTAELQEKLEATEQALTEQEEQVKAFATAGAIKKSVDPEDDEEGEELSKSAPKSVWDNVYLPQGLINSLGYKS
jgi:LPS O-antigen subunit length determinant protein (WzzB/FepE family)